MLHLSAKNGDGSGVTGDLFLRLIEILLLETHLHGGTSTHSTRTLEFFLQRFSQSALGADSVCDGNNDALHGQGIRHVRVHNFISVVGSKCFQEIAQCANGRGTLGLAGRGTFGLHRLLGGNGGGAGQKNEQSGQAGGEFEFCGRNF